MGLWLPNVCSQVKGPWWFCHDNLWSPWFISQDNALWYQEFLCKALCGCLEHCTLKHLQRMEMPTQFSQNKSWLLCPGPSLFLRSLACPFYVRHLTVGRSHCSDSNRVRYGKLSFFFIIIIWMWISASKQFYLFFQTKLLLPLFTSLRSAGWIFFKPVLMTLSKENILVIIPSQALHKTELYL